MLFGADSSLVIRLLGAAWLIRFTPFMVRIFVQLRSASPAMIIDSEGITFNHIELGNFYLRWEDIKSLEISEAFFDKRVTLHSEKAKEYLAEKPWYVKYFLRERQWEKNNVFSIPISRLSYRSAPNAAAIYEALLAFWDRSNRLTGTAHVA